MVALAAHSCPEANPFSRKGRVGEDKPPPPPMSPWSMAHSAPGRIGAPSATSPAATARHTPHAARHTHLLVTSVISSSSSSPPDTMLSSSSLIVVVSFGFCLLGVCLVVFVRSSLLGIKFLRFVAHCQSISQGRPHDFGRPGGAGGEGGGMHHTMPLVRSTCTYLPYVPCGTHTYIHTTS